MQPSQRSRRPILIFPPSSLHTCRALHWSRVTQCQQSTHSNNAHRAESVATAQQSPGMDASSAAAWSWPEAVRPAINKHIDNRHAAYNSSITPRAAAATAVQQIVVVHTKIRKATGPPPLDAYFFKRMCRRTSANNNNNDSNVVTGGGNYYPTFQRWPAYHNATAATATAASAMETLPGDRATATAASAIETLYVDRAATNATATMQTLPIEILRQIGAFAGGCFSLGETCKANLGVTNELHYAINIMDNAFSFSAAEDPTGALSNRHMMGMKPPGAYFNISSIAQDPSGGSLSSRHRMGGVNPTLAALPNEHMGGGGGGGGVKRPGALTTGRIVTRITVTGCTDLKDTHVRAVICVQHATLLLFFKYSRVHIGLINRLPLSIQYNMV